jgi:hypothetical protein
MAFVTYAKPDKPKPRQEVIRFGNNVVRNHRSATEQRNVRKTAYHITQADPTNIVSVRRGNCRWCWGANNEYQRTDWELERDLNRHIASSRNKGKTFPELGGGGFIKTKDPNPRCPICAGEGESYVSIEDFRKLSLRDRSLIAGVKMSKTGQVEEIRFHNKIDAINTFAKLDGMITEKKVVRILEATEADLDQYFNGTTIDHDDPDLAPFLAKMADAGPGVTVPSSGTVTDAYEEPAQQAAGDQQREARLARLRALKDAGMLD